MNADNPIIISCTVMQLAFVAWQTERFGLAAYKAATFPLTPTREFMAWWDRHVDSLASFRDACWRAWLASRGGSERVDAQPVTE